MNPSTDAGPKLPRQIVAQHAAALQLLKDSEKPADAAPVAATPEVPAVPTPPPFTVEELLSAPDATKNASRDYWHARAQAVEGFRREDNARAAGKIKSLEGKVQELTVKNTELVQSHPAAQPTIDLNKYFSEEEIESIGAERATAILRASTASVDTVVQERIDAAIKPLLDQRKESAEDETRAKQRKMVEELDAGFPAWQITDNDPRWRQVYLNLVDEKTGMTHQQILDGHKARYNAAGIVKMLEAFVRSLKPVPIPDAPPITPSSLEGNGGDAPPRPNPGAGDGVVLTAAEIKDGYKRIATNKMPEDEAALFHARVAAQMRNAGRG